MLAGYEINSVSFFKFGIVSMPSSKTDIEDNSQVIMVPPSLRRRLWYALIGAGVFNLVAIVQSLLRPGYDAWQQSVSSLSLGQNGWIQVTSFIFFGAAVISTVAPWRRILAGGRGAKSYPVLTLLSGISLVLCGILKQDPAPGYDPEGLRLTNPTLPGSLHLFFAGIGALSSIIGLIVIARRFAQTQLWRGWNVYSVFMAVMMAACIAVYSVWSVKSTGYAGTFERVALLIVPIWGVTFLIRLESGVPFMKKTKETPESNG
jgi:hypothetical protein